MYTKVLESLYKLISLTAFSIGPAVQTSLLAMAAAEGARVLFRINLLIVAFSHAQLRMQNTHLTAMELVKQLKSSVDHDQLAVLWS